MRRTDHDGLFIDLDICRNYLTLTAQETLEYEREIAKLPQEEQEKTMQLMTSMRREGIQEGLHKGKETLVARLINKRFGSIAPEVTERLSALSTDNLDDLGLAISDFSSLADLESWLSRHQPN